MVRRKSVKQLPDMGMSLLDIISCAVGASIILAILFSVIKTPLPTPISEQFIFIRLKAEISSTKGHLAYEIRTDKFIKQILPNSESIESVRSFMVDNDYATNIELISSSDLTESYLMINEPVSGQWFISPYIFEYEEGNVYSNDSTEQAIIKPEKYQMWLRSGTPKHYNREVTEIVLSHAGGSSDDNPHMEAVIN